MDGERESLVLGDRGFFPFSIPLLWTAKTRSRLLLGPDGSKGAGKGCGEVWSVADRIFSILPFLPTIGNPFFLFFFGFSNEIPF